MAEPNYPSAFTIADSTSVSGQRIHLRLLQFELAFLAVGSGLGAIGERESSIAASVVFVLAIVVRCYRMTERPDRNWHTGRASAESVKTLSWRYAVGGNPFGVEVPPADADRLFVDRIQEVLEQARVLDVTTPPDPEQEQITGWMTATRGAALSERQAIYRTHRLSDQQKWYAARAAHSVSRNRRWGVAVLAFECLGVVLAMVNAKDIFGVDGLSTSSLLGLAATLGAGAAAWMQARQYGALATAYTIAHQELGAIRSLMLHPLSEAEWASFVDSAEGAVSREHTMWRASRSSER